MTKYEIPVSFDGVMCPVVEATSREEAEELAEAEVKRLCKALVDAGEIAYVDNFVAAEEWMYEVGE